MKLKFPRGSEPAIAVDNIPLMFFNIYYDGLFVLQPLSVKDNLKGKKKNQKI